MEIDPSKFLDVSTVTDGNIPFGKYFALDHHVVSSLSLDHNGKCLVVESIDRIPNRIGEDNITYAGLEFIETYDIQNLIDEGIISSLTEIEQQWFCDRQTNLENEAANESENQ